MTLPSRLIQLIILGFILRLMFAFFADHVYYPDEIYQASEIGHQLVYGYAMIPWDIAYGLRSFMLPGLTAIPQLIQQFLPIPLFPPHLLDKLFFICFSLNLIPAVYIFIKKTNGSYRIAIFGAFITAVWYELIYFAARPFTESLAVNYYALAILARYHLSKKRYLSSFFLMVAFLFRPQYFILLIFLLLFWRDFYFKSIKSSLGGFTFAILLFGFLDWLTYGSFLSHLFTNLKLSFFSGISTLFGTKPWYYYFLSLLGTTGGAYLLSLKAINQKRLLPLIYLYLLIIFLHSFIPHKEYRFIYVGIPLLIIILAQIIPVRLTTYLITLIWSILGLFQLFPYHQIAYPYPPLYQDPYLSLVKNLPDNPPVCGIYHENRNWVYVGGYYHLHQKIPVFSYPDIPDPKSYNLILSQNPSPHFSYNASTCSLSIKHPYWSFPTVNQLLLSLSIKPVLKSEYGGI